MDSSPPPVPKKRRFFKDDLDDDPRISTTSLSEITPPTPISSDPPSPTKAQTSTNVDTLSAFAQQLLAILDEDLSPQVIRNLEDASAGNLERAVNMYFDGSWESHVRDIAPVGLITTASGTKRPLEPTLNNFITRTISPAEIPRKRTSPIPVSGGNWTRKYIGSLGVEGWAIGSGNNILKAGDPLLIERQNLHPPKPSKPSLSKSNQSTLKQKLSAPPSRFPIPSKQTKQHMLVRFTTLSGREIGRLPQETATFVSTLLDQNICSFDGVCIFAPEKIRTGDNILIQLRAYLLPQVFNPLTASKEDRPGVWEVSETEEERALKLRRIALLHLFNAIGLNPLRTSSMARQTSNARDQLLQAVQLPDPKGTGMSRSSSSQSSPPSGDDDGEGKEVAEDTLNLLYKKAQMYDPDMPTMDAPETFKFELRKYQKQALCWMVGKESGGEKDVRKQQSLNPLWEEYEWPPEDSTSRSTDGESEKFYLNPYSGEMSLALPTYESIHKGGILADGIFLIQS
jgi:DNA repair protein RAD5